MNYEHFQGAVPQGTASFFLQKAEGLAAARARGIKFGRPRRPLAPQFYTVHQAWRAKKLTLKQAAAACEMPEGTFYAAARRFEKGEQTKKALDLQRCTFANPG